MQNLVDWLRRYQILCTCTIFWHSGYAFCLFHRSSRPLAYLIRIAPGRVFLVGFFIYFVNCFQPFVVSVFWAFANAVTNKILQRKIMASWLPDQNLVAWQEPDIAILVLTWSSAALADRVQDVFNHQALLSIASFMILLVPFVVLLLIRFVPEKNLHGYEAVYKIEEERRKHGKGETGFLAGIYMLLRVPYVFGIFGIVFFYEAICTVLYFKRVDYAQTGSHSVSQMSVFLYKTALLMHFIGLCVSLIGTRTSVERLGEKALMLVPAVYGILLLYFMISYSVTAFVIVTTTIQALHYAFSMPLRETLYIPTVKEIKFKSKSWIDTFGARFGRSSSSIVRMAVNS